MTGERLTTGDMLATDLPEVLAIENRSFPAPWKREHFLHEIRISTISVNRVLRHDGRVVAYLCAWQVAGEIKINNVAVHPAWRRRGSLIDRRE